VYHQEIAGNLESIEKNSPILPHCLANAGFSFFQKRIIVTPPKSSVVSVVKKETRVLGGSIIATFFAAVIKSSSVSLHVGHAVVTNLCRRV
jgi:hypothetical protein